MVTTSHDYEEARIGHPTSLAVRVPPTDINACVRVPRWYAVLSVMSVLLAITDIPRSGLTFSAHDYYDVIGPGIVAYWGPWEYHTGHLAVASDASGDQSRINGSRDGKEIQSLSVWAYKQDTLSIAPRALANHLNVTSYPPCVLYRDQCASSQLDLTSVFTMLNDLVESIQGQLFHDPVLESQPFTFVTRSNWVDRLHHHLVLLVSRNPDVRSHSVYHVSPRRTSPDLPRLDPRFLCGNRTNQPFQSRAFSSEARPLLCDAPMKWLCDHPINATGVRRLPLWDHIAIRFDELQRRHQNLELDFTMLVSTLEEQSHSTTHILPSVSFLTDALEITTLIRGRRCDATHANCETVFIDDYRYERAAIESDEDRWRYHVSWLRGLSQLYVWIRVALLCAGCYCATSGEPTFHQRPIGARLAAACATMLKIPGQAIVYGSWLPLIGYALAHFFDSSLVQTVGEYAWTSVGGFYAFNPLAYATTASIQMRNVWMIALFWKLVFTVNRKLLHSRVASRSDENYGVVAFRGGWIGVVSWLTTFGLMRALHFRDTNIIEFVALPRHSTANTIHSNRNYSDYGYQFDLKCSFTVLAIVCSAGLLSQAAIRLTTSRASSIFLCRSFYVPHSAGTLWPSSALDTLWLVRLRDAHKNGSRVFVDPDQSFATPHTRRISTLPTFPIAATGLTVSQCTVCCFRSSILHWRSTQGCPKHEPIFDVHRRTKALWSMVRLMNIANMTDPIALFRLYVTGRTLYVYRVHSKHQPPYLLLLPMRVDRSDESETAPRWADSRLEVVDDGSAPSFELERTVDSRDVPWHLLVNCG